MTRENDGTNPRRERCFSIAQRLDDKGRCCGRKPLVYKRMHPPPHHYCDRCDRAYALDTGEQIENWAWKSDGHGGFYR
jgi:hypothetical protein